MWISATVTRCGILQSNWFKRKKIALPLHNAAVVDDPFSINQYLD
jgi:hypothetical protein